MAKGQFRTRNLSLRRPHTPEMAGRWRSVSYTFWSNDLANLRTKVEGDFIHTIPSYVVVPDLRGLEVGRICSAMSNQH